jgi:DNA-binding transcriptional regulator YdaS (Cro superfamily)
MTAIFPLLLKQTELAQVIGVSQSYISQILNGQKTVSPFLAEAFEDATAICREAWIWPSLHWNPYMAPGKTIDSPENCFSCFRLSMIRKKRMQLLTRWVALEEVSENDVFKVASMLYYHFDGSPSNRCFAYYKYDGEHLNLLASCGFEVFKNTYHIKDYPSLFHLELFHSEEDFNHPRDVSQLMNSWNIEGLFLSKTDPYLFMCASKKSPLGWQRHSVEFHQWALGQLIPILREKMASKTF